MASKTSDGRFKPNNTKALKHGGEPALVDIKTGKTLRGPARDAELAVYDELSNDGRYSLVVRNASRLQAACDLFWSALVGAAERQDMQALDRYVARFGWLAGASLRAWAQVKQDQQDLPDALDYEQVLRSENEYSSK